MKQIKITKQEYLDILNDNSRKLAVKKVKQGLKFKEVIFSGVDVVAERVVTADGVEYFKYA